MNSHTSGTEFYGGSSSLAFLARLFAKARCRAEGTHSGEPNDTLGTISSDATRPRDAGLELQHLSDRTSIVDLMYSTDYLSPAEHRPVVSIATDAATMTTGQSRRAPSSVGSTHPSAVPSNIAITSPPESAALSSKPLEEPSALEIKHIENIFIDAYFTSKHYIHPVLTESAFRARYTKFIWPTGSRPLPQGRGLQFLALYYAVVAQGAINSGMGENSALAVYYRRAAWSDQTWLAPKRSTLEWASIYFDMAKRYLGDVLEKSSLQMCQALFIMVNLLSRSQKSKSSSEGLETAIITVMVGLSRILKMASSEMYCDAEHRPVLDRWKRGLELTEALDQWRLALPPFLNFDATTLNDTVWAYTQKVVLKMRFYNARIVINRPFIVKSATSGDNAGYSQHVDICLDAARKTIHLIHDAFINRMYLRTWWYCTTYTLYASMIILYLILMDFSKVTGQELIADVEKSLEILTAMEQVVVARRCAELTKEMIDVAKRHLADASRRRTPTQTSDGAVPPLDLQGGEAVGNETWDHDSFLSTLISQEMPGLGRASALANLYDPNIMEGLAFSDGSVDQMAGYMDTTMGPVGAPYEERDGLGPTWGILEPYGSGFS
ncbi:hypothetical protein LTR08_003618 [Meristemomyces frigidus]|nr:hypothetical protein LTR08_003618 [Meristemomyces frigidus]